MAVAPFEDPTHSGQGEALSRLVEASLNRADRFRLIDRGAQGGTERADFTVTGIVTAASVEHDSPVIPGTVGRPCQSAVARIGLDIRVVDAVTGEIKIARHIDEMQRPAACGQADPDIASLLPVAANKAVAAIVTAIYPMRIAAMRDGKFVINYGRDFLDADALLSVSSSGDEDSITDPMTGLVLGRGERLLGFIRVTDVQPRFAWATTVTDFASPPPVGATVRPASAEELARFTRLTPH